MIQDELEGNVVPAPDPVKLVSLNDTDSPPPGSGEVEGFLVGLQDFWERRSETGRKRKIREKEMRVRGRGKEGN